MKRGTIVLAPFPFTDLTGRKVRPAIVVSRSDRSGTDVILAFMTTYRGQNVNPTDLLIENTHPDFASTGLKMGAIIKLDKLVTIDRQILHGELGRYRQRCSNKPTSDFVTRWNSDGGTALLACGQ